MSLGWPASLRIVRHAQSVGNVDSDRARREGREMWTTEARDPDVELSPTGAGQAVELGRHLAGMPPAPDVVWCSPFVRARRTGELAVEAGGAALAGAPWTIDERLRDRELGVVDRLTGPGIRARYPELADLRRRFGKFYFRPPGGESWADVGLRVRSVLGDMREENDGRNVLVFAHDVVLLMFRYVIESMDEATVLGVSRDDPVRNCGITTYRYDGTALVLDGYNRLPTTGDGGGPDQPSAMDEYSTRGSGR